MRWHKYPLIYLATVGCFVLAALGLASGAWSQVPGGPPAGAVAAANPPAPSQWWIGVQCRVADPALREQLGLEENVGLLVEEVVPNSPAAQAELRRYDVLVKAGGKDLRSVEDLVGAINAANGQPLAIELIRRGEKREVTVRPEKRPAQPPIPRWWFEWPGAEFFGRPDLPFRFRFMYPGWVVPPRGEQLPALPGNLTITITKKGDEPAKIVVKRDGQSWEVSENELEKLPADIRPYVEQMLRGGGPTIWGDTSEPGPKRGERLRPEITIPGPPWWAPGQDSRLRERMEQEFKELRRRVEELRESIEELRKRLPVPRVPGRVQPKEGEGPAEQGGEQT
jgi:membrane-associated protease RseP (regulator of RpoE activity)